MILSKDNKNRNKEGKESTNKETEDINSKEEIKDFQAVSNVYDNSKDSENSGAEGKDGQEVSDDNSIKEQYNNYIIIHDPSSCFVSTNNVCVSISDVPRFLMQRIFEEGSNNFRFLFVDEVASDYLEKHRWFFDKIAETIIEAQSSTLLNSDIIKIDNVREYSNSFEDESLMISDSKE